MQQWCMPTLVTHSLVGTALGQARPADHRKKVRFWFAAVVCSIAPDFDVFGSRLGVRSDLWGHRGLSHSLLFAAILATVATFLMPIKAKHRWKLGVLFFAITASHGVLDAMTNDGRGIAFFSPFDRHRYFFPWRPIQVSRIGAKALFSSDALMVLRSELWIWGPALGVVICAWAFRARRGSRQNDPQPAQSSNLTA